MVDYRYEVVAPYTALLHKDATHPGGTRNAIALFIQPVQPELCPQAPQADLNANHVEEAS